MGPLTVFLSAAPADSVFAQRLAPAIAATGTPVVTDLPSVGQGAGSDESKAPALVLVLSNAALVSPAQGAAIQLYEALLQVDSSIPVIPVLLDPVPPQAVPPALRGFQPVTAPFGMPRFHEALIDGVLQRLGLERQPGALIPALPLPLEVGPQSAPDSPAFDGASADAPPADASVADTLVLDAMAADAPPVDALAADEHVPSAPLDLATTTVVPVPPVIPVSELPTRPALAAAVLPAVPAVPPLPPRALTWRQRLERNRRPIAIGVGASLALLLIACVAFSLGVGSPGNDAANRLDSGGLGGLHGAAATATEAETATALPAPSASATRPKGTATTVHATPTGTHTAGTATPTAALPTPTPTLGPGSGLKGAYFHTTTIHPGTPVPYPMFSDSDFWFSRTDTIIDMAYGENPSNYTPPLAPFDSQVCPSQPSSTHCSPFGVRWTGFVRPRFTETYTFTTHSDDGVKLWINGQLIVNNWQIQGDSPKSGSTSTVLTAGQLYSIQIEYYENGEGPATMVLQWQSASQALEVIPQSQLYLPS
jgi:hypothetical protein